MNRYMARADLPETHPQAMTTNDNESRGGRFDYHDVIDTKTNRIAFRDDGNTDLLMCRRIAKLLGQRKKITRCRRCGEIQ